MTNTIREPARDVPVAHECDVCVIGGSTTGVFAAVAAARLGRSVALVEGQGHFGGVATSSLVTVWHTHLDTELGKPIMGGLLIELLRKLRERHPDLDRGATEHLHYAFSAPELMIELDRMIAGLPIRPFLHTMFVAPVVENGRVTAAIVEDKTGRRAIRARFFIDASGDADLVHRAGFPVFKGPALQPPTTAAIFTGLGGVDAKDPSSPIRKLVFDQHRPEALEPGFLWGTWLPGHELYTVVGSRVHGADCSDADQLTAAEIEGRRQVRVIHDMTRKHLPGGPEVRLAALPARIGIRQTRQAQCLHRLTEQEVLHGKRFPDAIANGSYRVDVHSAQGDGLIFRYLDGREVFVRATGQSEKRRWREETPVSPTFYQIPYRSLVPRGSVNVLAAGRTVDADEGAFGAIRVMVNCMQTGQAAGVAAHIALKTDRPCAEVSRQELRGLLLEQGAVVL